MDTTLIFLLYDSITNSVFESQVAAPLIKKLETNKQLHITIISFEPHPLSHNTLSQLPTHDRLSIKIESRFRFWGKWTLWPCAWRLKSFLSKFDRYRLMARGPLAGWIAQRAKTNACSELIIQARGLLAEEYAYTHPGLLAKLRTWQYKQLEASSFSIRDPQITIEAVSPALKQFLIEEYHTPEKQITIAHNDIPPTICEKQIQQWRIATRQKLNIAHKARVYCYNGSAKPWQCPQETIAYFKAQSGTNSHALLLVLTRDVHTFKQLCIHNGIQQYRICSVPYGQIYEYLAAADIGLLFREQHILNWVSRPTKALEYRAVGLHIIHNNTVAMLVEK